LSGSQNLLFIESILKKHYNIIFIFDKTQILSTYVHQLIRFESQE